MVKMTIQYNDPLAPYEHRYDKMRTCAICNQMFDTARKLKQHKQIEHSY
jgi:hypothetical protein